MALTTEQLDLIASAREVPIESREGELRQTMNRVVADDGEVFVRSFRGRAGRWYRRALANPEVSLIVGDDRYRFTAIPATDADSVRRTPKDSGSIMHAKLRAV